MNQTSELDQVLIPTDVVRAAVEAALLTVIDRAKVDGFSQGSVSDEVRQAAEAIANALRHRLLYRPPHVTPGEVWDWAVEVADEHSPFAVRPMLYDLSHRLDVIAAQLLTED